MGEVDVDVGVLPVHARGRPRQSLELREVPDEVLGQPPARAMADLLGSTRAALLAHLNRPRSTGGLSRDLHWSEPTVSYHLRILLGAGLVDRSRRGRQVFYRRTALGACMADR